MLCPHANRCFIGISLPFLGTVGKIASIRRVDLMKWSRCCSIGLVLFGASFARAGAWEGYAGDASHTAVSDVASQPLQGIRWSTPVDLAPQFTGDDLYIHYGSPVITSNNTVIVPVKTGATNGFEIQAHDGATGAVQWTATSDYLLPPHNWTPSYSPALTSTGRVYYAGAGGTVLYRDGLDSNSPSAPTRVAFFGDSNYAASTAAYNNNVFISTPITADGVGNVYFGYTVTGTTPTNLQSGIARVAANGTATFISAQAAAMNDLTINKVATNCAPALSPDGKTLYIAVNGGSSGDLVALNSATLAPIAKAALKDPRNGNNAFVSDDATASPMVGPDGTVFYGVLENPLQTFRGFMLSFSSDLSQTKTPGAFGWDDTASMVAASLVPSYHGSSSYLIMTKYNNYAGLGGDGVNELAILDPNDTQIDPRTGATVMKEVLKIAGVTPDDELTDAFPNAVREWCINTAVVDPATDSILANSEDGKLYRWDLATNTFSEVITLTPGLGEAYTPTLIGPDGTVYAINDATLFAVGTVPEPTGLVAVGAGILLLGRRRRA
jgi:hypothetical protein